MAQQPDEHPVVVVGGGFGGLFTTYHLTAGAARDRRQQVVMVSRDEEFVFKPLLPEAVGGTTRPQFLTNNLPRLAKVWGFTFRQTDVQGIDLAGGAVHTGEGALPYRDVVVALGSVADTRDIDVRLPSVFCLHELDDGPRLRAHVKRQVQRAVRAKSTRARAAALSFISVGGGPTGIETLAEIQEYVQACLKDAAAQPLAAKASYTVIEAGPEILPLMAPGVRRDVRRVLDRRGIQVITGQPVAHVEKDGCRLQDGRHLSARTTVWATGIRAHPVVRELGAPVDALGRLRVDNYLRARGHADVFALGDNACTLDPRTGAPLPATGQVAVQQAKVVADNILRRQQRVPLQPFKYTELGQLVPLGGGEAAGTILGRKVRGTQGWLASRAVYMSRILGLDNRIGLAWGWGRQAMTQSLLSPLWR